MIVYTTDDLVAGIKRVAHVPEAQSTFQPVDFLAFADTAMLTYIVPTIAGAREGYWTTYVDYQIDEADGINRFPIPGLAQGGGIIDAKLLVSQNFLPLDRIEINELTSTDFTPRPNYGYWVEDNILNVLPNGGITGVIRVWYNRMASQLVLPLACAQITEINGNDLTVSSVPSTFSTDTELDISSANPGFNVLLKDTAPTGINNSIITFASVPDTVRVGDYISLSGQSCVVQVPYEWCKVLEQASACQIYEAQGYLQKLAAADKRLEKMAAKVLSLNSPRQQQKTKYIAGGGSVLGPNRRLWPYNVGRRQ